MYGYFWISILCLLLGINIQLHAQQPPPATGSVDPIVKSKPSYKPTAVRLGANLFRLGRSAFDKDHGSWDVSGDINFYNYFIEVTYGRENNTLNTDSLNYENSGSFFRIGPEVNFAKDPTEGNAFIFGLKYAISSYKENFRFNRVDPNFGEEAFDLNNNLNASWIEMNVGVKGRVWQNLYLGFYFRYKFALSTRGDGEFATYQIPGYGLESRNAIVGFDYYVSWRIPFKKSPKIFSEE